MDILPFFTHDSSIGDNQRISIDLRGETLEAALWYLQNRTKFVFMYGTEDVANVTDITIRAKRQNDYWKFWDECLVRH